MSSITPPSFIDDGRSFTKRIPRGLHPKHVAHWITSTGSDASTYTGSFVDDGADMLLPHDATPGFGQIDPRFYKQRKRKEGRDGLWNEDVEKAIIGDIQRNLEKMRGLGGVEVKRHGQANKGEEKKDKDGVNIRMPPRWGTVVIKADNGRVVVIDGDGEFDSGPRVSQKDPAGRRWVQAASTIELSSPMEEVSIPPPSAPKQYISHSLEKRAKESNKSHSRSDEHNKSQHKHLSSPSPKALTPILESEYEVSCCELSGGEEVTSPTNFFMTGGASGWPSNTVTEITTPMSSAPITKSYEYLVPRSPVRSTSPVRSLPGGWPSPPQSAVKSGTASEQDWGGGGYGEVWGGDREKRLEGREQSVRSYRSRKSEKSHTSRRSPRQDFNNVSTKTDSVYKAPTVEDAPDTSSDRVHDFKKTAWGGSAKSNSVKDWSGSKADKDVGLGGSAKAASEQSWGDSNHGGMKSWAGSAKAADDERFTSSQAASEHDWGDDDKRGETSWDGYERVKTMTEVSVVGTGSKRSSRDSRASGRPSARAPSHGSRRSRSRTSQAHSEHKSPTGWGGSQSSRQSWSSEKARVDDDGWGGRQTMRGGGGEGSKGGSERSWNASHAGSKATGRQYANGYDEDNETYLNENWGGTRVRVGSRRTTVAGWE